MDLSQTKLNKQEWIALEIPITGKEMDIIQLIHESGNNINNSINKANAILDYVKINGRSTDIHNYLYAKYFKNICNKSEELKKIMKMKTIKEKKYNLKKADMIRLKNFDKKIDLKKESIMEYIMLNFVMKILKNKKDISYIYTLKYLLSIQTRDLNERVKEIGEKVYNYYSNKITNYDIVKNYGKIMKLIRDVQKFRSVKLYEHQKKVITICKNPNPKLVLYQAPTGTGKTLTPLGIVKNKKVIFVCAAKHIGLQLAKSCISLEIPIAIAFGCKDSSDIRLHYFAAKEITRNRKTGGIFRVDNSVGDKVEIIISDIQSYLPAMYYLCAFNKKEDIVLYWDEPTISLDQETHEFHEILKNNWKDNIIPNVVLSSATLPKERELTNFIMGFNNKFPGMKVYNIVSNNYDKTIPIVNTEGYSILPHDVFENYEELKESIEHIRENKTLLRHFDVKKICKFIVYLHENEFIKDVYKVNNYFSEIFDINTNSLKEYYLFILGKIKKKYNTIFEYCLKNKRKMYDSCIKITTSDAHTLKDGPTIFLTNNVEKLSMFYLKASKISEKCLEKIMKDVNENSVVIKEIEKVEKEEHERLEKLGSNMKEKDHSKVLNSTEYKLQNIYEKKLEYLKNKIRKIELPQKYVPNKEEHQKIWTNDYNSESFACNIEDEIIEEIMFAKVSNSFKILLMMGIGVFCENNCTEYKEIMKKMAQEQKLYLIIASSDYIYGTNYQFCHGYLSKDLGDISQEKMIQAFGRVGRSNMQKTYTIRLRNNDLIKKLLKRENNKPEVENMNKLFV